MPDNIINNILKCTISTRKRLVTCAHGKAVCKGQKRKFYFNFTLMKRRIGQVDKIEEGNPSSYKVKRKKGP